MESELSKKALKEAVAGLNGETPLQQLAAALVHDFLLAAEEEGQYRKTANIETAAELLGKALSGTAK
ncbi:MAG: hypothetical protein F4Y67_01120 [Chloroflexi bacterium]|nr:hypothetical protein [Chloroflexota bacterium]